MINEADVEYACRISGQPFLLHLMKTAFMNISIGLGWRLPPLPFPYRVVNSFFMKSDDRTGASDGTHCEEFWIHVPKRRAAAPHLPDCPDSIIKS